MRADHLSGVHSEPVWRLEWVDRGAEFEEVLVTSSTDGRVCQWTMGQVSTMPRSMTLEDLTLCC